MRISDVLSSKGAKVITIQPDAGVDELVALLATHNLGAVVVSVDGKKLDGIVSERDVVRGLARTSEVMALHVSDLMTTAMHTCRLSDSIEIVMGTMTDQRVRHVPVVVNGQLAGIVSIGDVVKATISELQFERDQLQGYVTS
ncbi:MAG: CBS domain-containing protein [Propionibacteriaceae bacterium]